MQNAVANSVGHILEPFSLAVTVTVRVTRTLTQTTTENVAHTTRMHASCLLLSPSGFPFPHTIFHFPLFTPARLDAAKCYATA